MKKILILTILIFHVPEGLCHEDSVEQIARDSMKEAEKHKKEALASLELEGSLSSIPTSSNDLENQKAEGPVGLKDPWHYDSQPLNEKLEGGRTCRASTCGKRNQPETSSELGEKEDKLIIFVSFSLPDESLKA